VATQKNAGEPYSLTGKQTIMHTNKSAGCRFTATGLLNKFFTLLVAHSYKLAMLLLLAGVTLSAVAQNSPPNIDTLTYCTGPMTPVVLCNSYTDPNGDPVAVVGGHTTFNCSLVFLNDTCVRYTPLPGFMGTDIVYLDICDNQNPAACSVFVYYVHVGCLPPLAYNDQALITPGNNLTFNGATQNPASGAFNFPVLQNDDPLCQNRPVSVAVVLVPPANGTYAIAPGGSGINYTPNPGFTGADAITYVACNNCPLCDTATVTITVAPTEPPCNPDVYICLPPDTALDFCPEFCNIDAANIATYDYAAVNGTVNPPTDDGCFTYVPNLGFTGEDIVTVTACDTGGNCSTAFAYLTFTNNCGGEPIFPTAQNDAQTTYTNTPVVVQALSNDVSPDGQTLTITSVSSPANGTAVISPDGLSVQYFPNSGFTGANQFTYTVCNTQGNCATATITITVVEPCQNQLSTCTQQGVPVQFCVSFCNLSGMSGISITGATSGYNTSINQLWGNCLAYTPLPAFTGTDTLTVTACAESGLCDVAQVIIEVGCIAPQANTDNAQTPQNTSVSIPVTNNDTAFCNASPAGTVSLATPPANGSATVDANGSINYFPNPDFTGSDVLTYTLCTDCAPDACTQAQVFITVTAVVTPQYDEYMAQPDVVQTPFNTAVTIPVLQNDLGADITIVSYSLAANGVVAPNPDGTFIYIPLNGFSGVDYFFYQICNTAGACQQTIVAVTVLPNAYPAMPPIAHTDMAVTPAATPITITVLANDSDPQALPLTITATTAPTGGAVALNPNGTITYTPNAGFTGTDLFTYTICNTQTLCNTASVSVAVGGAPAANLSPFAQNDFAVTPPGTTVNIPLLENDTEPNGQPLAATVISNPMNGTVSANPATGIATYTPNAGFEGVDYFTYMACNNGLPVLCDTAYVSVTVGSGNVPPIAQDDTAFGLENATVHILVIINDSDANDPLADLVISAIPTPPQNGTVTINSLQVIYQPNPGFTGADQFTYLLCDPMGACDEATVIVIINPAVAANPDAATTPQNNPVTINVLTNDQGVNIGISNLTQPANGSATALPDGNITYTPNTDFTGTDQFTYTICDNMANCSQTTVTITVLPDVPQLPPIAQNDTAITEVDMPLYLNILLNDSDPQGLPLAISNVVQPPNGTAIWMADGNIDYVPNPGFTGTDQFSYTVCNEVGLCADALVMITVLADTTPVAPAAVSDTVQTNLATPVIIAVLNNDVYLPSGAVVTLSLQNAPQNGTATLNPDNTFTYTPNPSFTGADWFVYTLQTSGGTATATVFITITNPITPPEDCPVMVAQGFSPNGDGTNETFLIAGIDEPCFDNLSISLTIFNRWGDVMYAIPNYRNSFAWNGEWQGKGKQAPAGTYYYTIEYLNANQEVQKLSGFIELMR